MMNTSHSQHGSRRVGLRLRKGIAAFAAYSLSLTTVVLGVLPATPAAAAPGPADLAVTKIASNSSALVGTSVDFTVTVSNLGSGDTTGVAVTDVLPTDFTFQSYSATTGTYDQASGVWSVGSMLSGSSHSLTITARASSVALAINTAAVTASDQPDPVPGNDIATAAVNIVTVPPAVCSTDEIIGIAANTIYSINTLTGAATAEFTTTQTSGVNLNALASNSDLGIVYWGTGTTVYWWNSLDDTEGVLVDLSGQINGTLESAGATYHDHFYYFSAEVGGNANGLYRIAIDPLSGTGIVPGSLEELAPNEPEDSLESILGIDARPDYGDMTVVSINGEPVMYGSIVDAFDSSNRGYWWSYDINSGTLSFIAYEQSPNHVQLGTDLNGNTWGTDASGNLYGVNLATGQLTPTGDNVGRGLYDLSGSFCVAPPLADIDTTKALAANDDADGSGNVSLGDTLTYQVTATNTGNIVLNNVSISDPLSGLSALSCSESMPATLTAGEPLVCTATYTVVSVDQAAGFVANTATATGTPPSGGSVSDSSSLVTPVAQPEVLVTKSSDAGGPVVAGQVITYSIDVENTGNFAISDLSVVDPLPAGTTYVADSTVVDGWFAAGPSSTSALATTDAAISTDCSAPTTVSLSVSDNFAVSDVTLGFTASHGWRSDIRLDLISPLGNTTQLMPGDRSDSNRNYDVLFDATSTNPLNDGDRDQSRVPDYERSVAGIGLASFAGEPSQGTWTLEICDTYPSSGNGTFRQAEIFIAGVPTSAQAVTLDNVPAGVSPDLDNGVPPVLVTGVDDLDLPLGATMTITYQVQVDASLDGVVTEIVNDVTVSSDELPPTTDYTIDPIDFAPELEVVKGGPAGPIAVGDTVTYTYTVTHTAASDGSPVDVTVIDDIIDLSAVVPTGDTDADGLLDGGETWIYSVDYTVPVATADPLVNVATVSGTDLNDEDIPEDTDDHTVDVEFAPVLTVEKVGSPDPAVVGDTINYTYTVNHTAASDLSSVSNVAVVDSRGLTLSGPSGDTNSDGLLDGTETWVYTATETVTTTTPDPLTNDVTVNGTDRDDDDIPEATDSESIDIEFAPV
ncbi:MAG: DUF11 domain-containing protein, partial [bacterium]|nr:DUF11 domain-containing protein [bacterium]